jgi:lipopolysaccharide export system ATP-binding protein
LGPIRNCWQTKAYIQNCIRRSFPSVSGGFTNKAHIFLCFPTLHIIHKANAAGWNRACVERFDKRRLPGGDSFLVSIRGECLVKAFNRRNVVDGVSVEVSKGEVVGLLGPNGAGKTTTFYMIVGLEKPDSGSIHLDGKDVTKMPMHRRAQVGVGYLAQEASIFRKMTVEDNIMALLEVKGIKGKERKMRMEGLLDEFRIAHVRKRLGFQLSGGERRRAEIARALATDPSYILLDEPFAGVDPIAVSDIQAMISHLKEKNLGILITDHNVRETLAITDRAYIMHEGRILVSGTPEEISNDEMARKFYLGERFSM